MEGGKSPKIDHPIPENIVRWSERSWKKLFVKYMIENDLYFSYPYIGYSTNNADIGENVSAFGNYLQGRLMCFDVELVLTGDISRAIRYDAWGEMLPECFSVLREFIDGGVIVDINKVKEYSDVGSQYILTQSVKGVESVKSFCVDYVPAELNIMLGNIGSGLSLYDRNKVKVERLSCASKKSIISGLYPLKGVGDGTLLLYLTVRRRLAEAHFLLRRYLRKCLSH
jgi:hypothetical protein